MQAGRHQAPTLPPTARHQPATLPPTGGAARQKPTSLPLSNRRRHSNDDSGGDEARGYDRATATHLRLPLKGAAAAASTPTGQSKETCGAVSPASSRHPHESALSSSRLSGELLLETDTRPVRARAQTENHGCCPRKRSKL